VKIAAVIAAAGLGKRMDSRKPKQFLTLAGKPVLWHTLQRFIKIGMFSEIVLVINRGSFRYCQQAIVKKYKFNQVKLVIGGKERQDSVYHGLKSLSPCDYVVIHDGVRCLVTAQIIRKTIQAACKFQAAVAAVPIKDTIKESVIGHIVKRTIDRDTLWMIQTPQVFRYDLIMKAYQQAAKRGFYSTDDASLVEKLDRKVKLVMASYNNIKITTAIDLSIAENVIRKGWQ
jgi:2-C-methyl-D-erythritol 4-phosphate cytidylyltransferase